MGTARVPKIDLPTTGQLLGQLAPMVCRAEYKAWREAELAWSGAGCPSDDPGLIDLDAGITSEGLPNPHLRALKDAEERLLASYRLLLCAAVEEKIWLVQGRLGSPQAMPAEITGASLRLAFIDLRQHAIELIEEVQKPNGGYRRVPRLAFDVRIYQFVEPANEAGEGKNAKKAVARQLDEKKWTAYLENLMTQQPVGQLLSRTAVWAAMKHEFPDSRPPYEFLHSFAKADPGRWMVRGRPVGSGKSTAKSASNIRKK